MVILVQPRYYTYYNDFSDKCNDFIGKVSEGLDVK